MELRRIKYLAQVARLGSLSRAAAVLGLAQPALSRQLKRLEEEYGAPLLYRHGRGVALTPEGERFLEQLWPMTQQMDTMLERLRDRRGNLEDQVTLGLTPTVCKLLGLQVIQALHAQHPGLRLNIVSGYSGYVHEWLTSARLDLAVLHDARRSSNVLVRPLADMQLFLVSSPALHGAPEEPSDVIALAAVQHLPVVLPTENHGLRRTMESAMLQQGYTLNLAFEMDNFSLMREMTIQGLAHTILAYPAVQEDVLAGRLIARRIVEPAIVTRLMLAKSPNRPLTQALRCVESEIDKALRQLILHAPTEYGLTLSTTQG
ncbi:MAG: LysR family transcriptional regulator [Burkholderiaceae bacterium]|uniref:LysR family transcriptional regulator n=1 Tax=Castellaniella sp. TaxID=1955812 RepID=UPI00355FC932